MVASASNYASALDLFHQSVNPVLRVNRNQEMEVIAAPFHLKDGGVAFFTNVTHYLLESHLNF
jgi:hypothetical protein